MTKIMMLLAVLVVCGMVLGFEYNVPLPALGLGMAFFCAFVYLVDEIIEALDGDDDEDEDEGEDE